MTKPTSKLWLATSLLVISALACNIFTPGASSTPRPTATAAVPTTVPTPLPPIAPRVVDYTPERGDELPVNGAITVYFDAPMDRASTEAAFSIAPKVTGTFGWPDETTMVFTPGSALERAARYVVNIDAKAKNVQGLTLPAPVSFAAATVGFLEVAQALPAANTDGVDVNTVITLMFNRPVVPLTSLGDQASLPNPLSLEPAVSGKGEWLNTSIFVFHPDAPLGGGQTYTSRVKAGLTDTTGGLLKEDFAWQFTTVGPMVVSVLPTEGEQAVGITLPISLTFNQPMDHASTQAAFAIQPPVEGAFAWSPDGMTLGFQPASRLAFGTDYQVKLAGTAQSANQGASLGTPYTLNFRTVSLPAVLSTDPADGAKDVSYNNGFRIYFASPMDLATLWPNIQIIPEPTDVYTYWSDYNLSFYVGWGMKASSDYQVSLKPGMADPYGNVIATGQDIRFSTARLSPQAYFNGNGPFGTYSAYTDTEFYITTLNVEQVHFELYRLSLPEFASLTGPDQYNAYQNYKPSAQDQVREPWQLDVLHPLNESILTRVPLMSGEGGALPPGLYFLKLTSPGIDYDQHQIFSVSGANLTLKATLKDALIWATDLNSGQPIANLPIALYNDQFQKIAEGQTDAQGVFKTERSNPSPDDTLWNTLYAVSQGGPGLQSFSATLSDWSDGIDPWSFGVPSQYQAETYQSYLYTDRPLYRPGQVVYFKGILRKDNDARYLLPDLHEVTVVINNDQGERVYTATLPLNGLGTFTGQFQLAEEAGLGYYNVSASDAAGNNYGGVSFTVAEYRKPEYQATVTSPVTETIQGSSFPVTLNASYFSGGGLPNAKVHWTVLAADYVFQYQGQGYYDFYDFDYSSGENPPTYGAYGEVISENDGQTDAQGNASLEVTGDLSKNGNSRVYTIEATVTDVDGRQVSGRTEVVVHQGQYYIGVRPEEYVAQAGQPATVDLLTVDWTSNPMPNQKLHVVYNDHQWNCALETDPDTHNNAWTCHAKDTPVATDDVTTDAQGQAKSSFVPPKGGVYQVKVTGTDSTGHTMTSSTIIWAWSDQYVSWRQQNNDRINLVTDRKSYRVGDTAEILIPSPFQGETEALVTIERGRIIQHEVIKLTTNSTIYKLPITADFAPDVFFSILIIKGVDDANPAPAFKMGLAKLSVNPEQLKINLALTPDKAQVGPRDTVNYRVKATDYAGQPVQGEFSFSVVDLALLSLSTSNTGPILDAFYSERGLGVRTSTGLTLGMDRINIQAAKAKGGGGGAEGASFSEVRTNFLDTAYWNASVVTDQNGEGTVSVKLPDNLTTWRLDARGVTANTLVGQSTVDIVATKPLLVRPFTPRFFVVGDQAQVTAVVNNNTNQDIQTTVTVAGTGVTFNTPGKQVVTVKAHDRTLVAWDVSVSDIGDAAAGWVDLTFTAEGAGLKDASKPTLGVPPDQLLPVYKYSVAEDTATAGQLENANALVEAVSLPKRFDASQGALSVELDPSLAAGLTEGLTYLEHYPYECTEQTVSRFLPNVLTYRALKALNLAKPELEANLTTLVNTGLQRLYVRQHVDGGWGWWSNDTSDAYISAYVVFGLAEAKKAGFAVSDGVIERGVTYLQGQLVRPIETSETWQLNRQAFILYTLADAGQGNTSATVLLFDYRTRLDTYARAYLALTFSLIDANDARINTLLSDINSAAILSATGAHWEEKQRDEWNMNTDTRSTAIVLDALARLDKNNALIPNVVRWLMVARKAAAWETTQETAWALIGLTDWMSVSGELNGNYAYDLSLNGKSLASGNVNADNLRDPIKLRVAVSDLFKDQANRLVISRGDGAGRLYYTANLNLYYPVESVRAASRGIIVSRQYYIKTPDCGGVNQPVCQPVTAAKVGDNIQVKVTLIAPNDLYYVVLEDPFPAGAEAVDTSLQTTSVVGQAPELKPSDPLYYGWGWWWFSNTDLRDEKVVLFATYLPKGTYEYNYTLHAALTGTYRVIPTHANEFYFPEVFGHGDGQLFTIKP
jgi:alpha-2-macroglobulin